MQINTKFKIGQSVYFVYKDYNLQTVQVLKDKIKEIVITEQEAMYYGDERCEAFKEDETVDINDGDCLIRKIRELSEEVQNGK
ncbi:hypothetical protein [uncultured Thomasclavelia sp.]|uniref:hypothetical protein n=1 Tax=uncultured Thomasclavelia sp. TaxID=3025759 RepID=UPI00259815CA|nr:hypothetical protein [uncultured Thomasclavelia sp.]